MTDVPPDPEPIANETASGYARRRELVAEARAALASQPVPEPGLDVDATPEYDHHWRPAGSRNAGPALTSRPPCPICHSTDIEHAPTCPHPSSLSARLTSPEPTPPAPEPK